MVDSMLMTTAMQHAVGRATHDELRAELNRRIAANDVIAEEPLFRLASDREDAPGKSRGVWESEVKRTKALSFEETVRYIDEAIRKGGLGSCRGALYNGTCLENRAVHPADGA